MTPLRSLPLVAALLAATLGVPAAARAQAPPARHVSAQANDPVGDSFGPPGSDIQSAGFGYSPDDGAVGARVGMDPAHPVPSVLVRVVAGVYTADGRCDATDGVVADVAPGGQTVTYHLPGDPTPVVQFAPVDLTGRTEVLGRTFTCVQAASLSDDGQTVYDGTEPAPMYDLNAGPPPGYFPAPAPAPAPVLAPAPAPAPALRLALHAAGVERPTRLRFTAGASRPGIYAVSARLGGLTLRRPLAVRRAGSVTFGLTPTAAESRRLRRALVRGPVRVHASIAGGGTSARVVAWLRR